MAKFLRSLDSQDLQLVTGLSMLGYGLFLVSPPACFIALGSLLLAPIVLPSLFGMWRAK